MRTVLHKPITVRKDNARRWKALAAAFLAIALMMAPYSFGLSMGVAHEAGYAAAGGHHGHNGSQPIEDGGLAHIVAHCGAQLCAPSYVETRTESAFVLLRWSLISLRAESMIELRSLYLESDPPFPRTALS
jgi:hypothetical protein